MNTKNILIFIVSLLLFQTTQAQRPEKLNSSEIFQKIQKLNFLGSVLYVAAHPDDENTRLISYLSNTTKARTAYLSLTRGDGGQNLIGPELRESLGLIRTQELLEARKIDGGQQFFTRANDFGFSKHPDETLEIWNKEQVLSDMVWIIRKFRPDVIINRFDHRSPGTTHGHHTASALLSLETEALSGNPNQFPEQLKWVKPYTPKRFYFNTSWWFYGSKEKFEGADKSKLASINIGTYFSTLGKSNQEIAALSRSCHQSQGFGTTGTRGEEIEYLEFLKGEVPRNKANIFDGIDTTWKRVENGQAIGNLLKQVEQNFNFTNPSASIPDLIKAYQLIESLSDDYWKEIKKEEIKQCILACAGLYLDANTSVGEITPGSPLLVNLEIINRSDCTMELMQVSTFNTSKLDWNIPTIEYNKNYTKTISIDVPKLQTYTSPYWINKDQTEGMYAVHNQELIGIPDVIRDFKVQFQLKIQGVLLTFDRNLVTKTNDEVKGEQFQPLSIIPDISLSFTEKVHFFSSHKEQKIQLKITSNIDNTKGNIRLEVPQNWNCLPTEIPFECAKKGEEHIVTFTVKPPKTNCESVFYAKAEVNGKSFDSQLNTIHYPHIYNQIIVKPTQTKAIKTDLKIGKQKIAYIMGAGDEVPKGLIQIGYTVQIIKPEDITTEKLLHFDVVITGIRAYNVLDKLAIKQKILFDFVHQGKRIIVQYNTNNDLVTSQLAPYSIKISKDRITNEKATVTFLAPNHPILNKPNKITNDDFLHWKQEQGLYYASEWDKAFTPIISANDKDETPKNSGILVANYGKGTYVYTSLSFFRELPEGVPGAYRLLANLISF